MPAAVTATKSSDGRSDVWCTPSGMVGDYDGAAWAFWMPTTGVEYTSSVAGGDTVTVRANGDGTYSLQVNGAPVSVHAYDIRWISAKYFNASGGGSQSVVGARSVGGDPQQIYFKKGDVATAADVARQGTQSSDGRTDVWATIAGLAGMNVGGKAGQMVFFKPTAGVTIQSRYLEIDVAIRNNGDGSYNLLLDGAQSRLRYAPRWNQGTFFDSAGNSVPDQNSARVMGDPQSVYFRPGELTTQSNVQSAQPSTSSALPPGSTVNTPQPVNPSPVTTTPGGNVSTPLPPVGTLQPQPWEVATPLPLPITEPFPPDGAAGSEPGISKNLLILGAALAAFMFSR